MSQASFTLGQLAELTDSQLVGNPLHLISNVADLQSAENQDVSFLGNLIYLQAMRKSRAGAIFVPHSIDREEGKNYLLHENPTLAFQKALDAILGQDHAITGFEGIHVSAQIHPSATIGENVTLGPCTVIDKQAVIGDGTQILAGSYVGPGCKIGRDCLLHANVTLREGCVLGDRVIIQPGAVIGSCGFGYTPDKQGRHSKLTHFGNVVIEDDVEIGANTTVDRARFKTTLIKQGTKIDNLVQIAHNVQIGRHTIVVAQTGIAGSTEIGNHVVIAGQVAIAGHVKIADFAVLSAKTGISKTITKPGKYGGAPAMPLADYNRMSVHLRNIDDYVKRIEQLEQRLTKLEQN